MQRLDILKNQLRVDTLKDTSLTDLLKQEDNLVRLTVREFAKQHVAPSINEFVETATFPQIIIDAAKPYNFFMHLLPKPYGGGTSYVKKGLIFMELARVDAGLGTFFAVQLISIYSTSLVTFTLNEFGTEFQKQKYLTKVRDLSYIGGWALTEPDYGSDATSLQSKVVKVEGGYILNGHKRWIGSGNRDIMIVWAKNDKQIQGFIVEMSWKGISSQVIKNKMAMRIVQNCDITFENVFIPDENKLNVTDFQQGPNVALAHSRTTIPWLGVGVQLGVYESVLNFITTRRQFQKPIASFQLQQERLVRIISIFQASFLLALRTSELADEGKATIGMISSCKAWISDKTREVARLGREMFGGNGIITDNYVIKALTDAEVIYTYEGTYDINTLIAGRELTGISAFK